MHKGDKSGNRSEYGVRQSILSDSVARAPWSVVVHVGKGTHRIQTVYLDSHRCNFRVELKLKNHPSQKLRHFELSRAEREGEQKALKNVFPQAEAEG